MAALLALVATILTSLLPILNKRLLRDARPALVAWIVNAASLPILLAGTLLLTQCSVTSLHGSMPFSCTARLPHIDGIFVAALVASALLNWAATLLSTIALTRADASLVSPLLTFNPAFTLLLAWPTLGETPGLRQTIGVALVLCGAYLLEVEEVRTGLLAPLRVLLQRAGTLLAMVASALWGATTVLEKLAIEHVTPSSGPLVALLGTFLLVVLLTPGVLRLSQPERPSPSRGTWQGLRPHARALFAAIALAGVAPLFGFTAIALGLVGYVTTLFKLSALFTILWARVFLGEGQMRSRLFGACVMVVGGGLVAA
jgi:drug/metabolite transporter (DMT)-like permease